MGEQREILLCFLLAVPIWLFGAGLLSLIRWFF